MPELELLEACPKGRRFREENHGPHLNPSVGSLELGKGSCITSARVCRKPHEEAFSLLSGCSGNQAKEAMPCLLAGWGRGGWPCSMAKHMKSSNLPPSVGYVAQWQSG